MRDQLGTLLVVQSSTAARERVPLDDRLDVVTLGRRGAVRALAANPDADTDLSHALPPDTPGRPRRRAADHPEGRWCSVPRRCPPDPASDRSRRATSTACCP